MIFLFFLFTTSFAYSQLKKTEFPDSTLKHHIKIFKLLKGSNIEYDGVGKICKYFDKYLLNLSIMGDHGYISYFYNGKTEKFIKATIRKAFRFYKGKQDTSFRNAENIINHVISVNAYNEFIVKSIEDIPHKCQNRHSYLSFEESVLKNGIFITYPNTLTFTSGPPNFEKVHIFFTYCHLGGQVKKYELYCGKKRIEMLESYTIGRFIGDLFFIK